MLSPVYVNYVTQIVGMTLTKALLIGISPVEQNQLVLAALVLGQDPEAKSAVQEGLQDKGDLINEIWKNYCNAVNQHNAKGVVQNFVNINQLIERAKQNADRGQDPTR